MENEIPNSNITNTEVTVTNPDETLPIAEEQDKKVNEIISIVEKHENSLFETVKQIDKFGFKYSDLPKGFYDTLEKIQEKEDNEQFKQNIDELLVRLHSLDNKFSIEQHFSEKWLYFSVIWAILDSDNSSLLGMQEEYNHMLFDSKNNATPNSFKKTLVHEDCSTEEQNWYDNEITPFHSLMYQSKDLTFNKLPGIRSELDKLYDSQQNDQSDEYCQLFKSFCQYLLMSLQVDDELENQIKKIYNTYEWEKNRFIIIASEIFLNKTRLKCQMAEDIMYSKDYLRNGLIEANKAIHNPSLEKDDIEELQENYWNAIFNTDILKMYLTYNLERDINCDPENFYGGFFIERPSNHKLKKAYENAFNCTVDVIEKLYNELWRLGYLKKSVNVMHSFVYRLTQYLPYGIEIEPAKITWGNGENGDVYALLHFAKNAFGINKGYKKDYFERCEKIFEFDTTKNPDLKFPDKMNYRSIQHKVSPELTRIANEFSTTIDKIHKDYNKKVEKFNKKQE